MTTGTGAAVKLTDIIGRFDGRSDFSEWIKRFELVADLQGITKLESFLPLFLIGDAYSLYESLNDADKKKYETTKSALTKAFCPTMFAAFEAFTTRRYQHGEAVDVYLSDLRRLGKLVASDLPDNWIKCAFLAGLPEEVKLQMKAATAVDSMDLSKVVDRARTIMSVVEAPLTGMVAKTKVEYSTRQPLRPPRKCFLCGEISHLARSCPLRKKTVTCFACGEAGHRVAECPARASPKNE